MTPRIHKKIRKQVFFAVFTVLLLSGILILTETLASFSLMCTLGLREDTSVVISRIHNFSCASHCVFSLCLSLSPQKGTHSLMSFQN